VYFFLEAHWNAHILNSEALKLIKESVLFRDLKESMIDSALEHCQTFKYKSNSYLYKSGAQADQLYFILDGVVQLIKSLPNHQVQASI
jgi:CRP-like cAMP-binding protein